MMIIYDGPSLLDGKPIVVIATKKSGNAKTGDMVQTYILCRDIDPRDANKRGDDYSICGNCKHRGTATDDPTRKLAKNRSCYVNIGQGVLIVWKAFQRGAYDAITGHDNIAAIGAGRMVRLGTYGDPSAVPAWIWESLLSQADGWTGYSHQADVTGADYRPDMVMRSADTEQEARDAWQNGERTFRVVANVADIIAGREILCPASKEAGQRVQCHDCKLCAGSSIAAKSIAIPAHGAGATHFTA